MLDPIIGGALIGGAMDIFGGLLGSNSAAKEARKDRQFQMEMANTAVQRRVADLKKSGLNPMLAFMGSGTSGLAAGNPPGANAASAVGAALSGGFSGAGSKAAQALMLKAQISNLEATSAQSAANARKANAEAGLIETTAPTTAATASQNLVNLEAQLSKLGAEIARIAQETQLSAEQLRHNKVVNPLLEHAQSLVNEAKRLGLTRSRAEAVIFDQVNKAATPAAANATRALIKDTVNMLEDKAGHIKQGVSDKYRQFQDWWRAQHRFKY